MASAVGAAPLEGADAPIPGPQDLPDDILVTLMLAMDLPSRCAQHWAVTCRLRGRYSHHVQGCM